MKKTQSFNEWNSSFNENDTVAADVEVASTTNVEISKDVDTIINSLETLANELSEDLNAMQLDEAEAVDFIKSWIMSIKATNAQRKVNKIKMNSVDLEFAAKKAEGDKKSALKDKSELVKAQSNELQKMVNDRFSGKGSLVDSKLSKAKIEGQLEIIKRTSGMEDDPARKSDLKTKMKELADKYREEEAAIAKLEDDNKDVIEAEKERINKEAENKKSSNTDSNVEDAQAAKDAEDAQAAKDAEDAQAAKDAEDAQAAKDAEDAQAAKDPKVKALEDEIAKLEQELTTAENSPNKNKEGISVLQASIVGKKKSLKTLKDKVQDSLIIRANSNGLNELAVEIGSKLDWQVSEGTALYLKYDEIIKKAEYTNTLNESRYNNLSIKDRFARLL
jgi:chromosome segregation ATPase